VTVLDAVVVGSGPNGLAAALTVARAGCSVLVLEAADHIGGGARTEELTLPGFRHDVCSAFHPFGVASTFFRSAELHHYGLQWAHPAINLAHPLDGGRAASLVGSVDDTAAGLGADAGAYRRHMGAVVRRWAQASEHLLGPVLRIPRHPVAAAGFGLAAVQPATLLARRWFATDEARALLAGCCAHSFLPLTAPFSASVGLALAATGHMVGWPVAVGGSGEIARALGEAIVDAGGNICTDRLVERVDDLPAARAVFLDVNAAHLPRLLGDRLPARRQRAYKRFRPGPAAFKIDYALDGPIPWTADACRGAGTVHVGGTTAEIAAAEAAINQGRAAERPFVLVGQQSVPDPSRAPAGRHTAWVYGHVPNGYSGDARPAIEAQIERFAPGFGDVVLARSVRSPADFERENPNYVGGDIATGGLGRLQVLRRPVLHPVPYRTGAPGYYLCSASTPPGAGAHGLCGWHAARAALGRELADRGALRRRGSRRW